MNKFKVGDTVKTIKTGELGEIVCIIKENFYNVCVYCVLLDNGTYHTYTANEIELVQKINEILTEEEKEYLSNLIKPFRNEIKSINKVSNTIRTQLQYIIIGFENNDLMCFPDFETGKYYKNMELEREYTLKELGL